MTTNTRTSESAPLNAALSNFDQLPDAALVRLPTVAGLFGISGPTVWRWARDGRLPPPVRIGGATGWRVGELRATLSAPAV